MSAGACLRACSWLVVLQLVACGGGSDGGSDGSITPPPGGDGAAGTGGSGGSPPADGRIADAAPADLAPLPPPMARLLVKNRARLIGTHRTACSHQVGSPERWCGYTVPGASLGKTDLWVINVTRAMAADVPCDGTSASCLRLSTDLWTGAPMNPPFHPYSHHFFGDTLIFYANTPSDVPAYKGPIYAWRPGWPAARQITGSNAFSCDGHPTSDVASCLENVTVTPGMPTQYDLHAGRLGANPLPMVAHIVPARADGAFQTDAAFSPAGDYFAYSAGGLTMAEPETLYLWKVDDLPAADKRVMVAANVSRWDFSADGKRWYWLRNFNYPVRGSGVQSQGDLATADFPAGGNEKMVAKAVNTYQLLDEDGADRGAAILDGATAGGVATYKLIRDVAKPEAVTTVSAGVGGFAVSPDLRFSVLQTVFNSAKQTSDVQIIKNDGSGRCTLAAMPTADDLLQTPFLPHAGLVFWVDNVNATTGLGEGWLAKPDGCAGKLKFADALDFWFTVRDDGLIFSDTSTGLIANIRYAKLGGGAWPAGGPVTIKEKAGWVYAPLGAERDHVVYYIDQGTPDDGLYVYGPIGFGRP
jgi:hypothetical protein